MSNGFVAWRSADCIVGAYGKGIRDSLSVFLPIHNTRGTIGIKGDGLGRILLVERIAYH